MSVTISVIDVLTGDKFSFRLGANTSFNVTHLKHEVEQFYPREESEDYRLLFIRDGIVLNDDDYILPSTIVEDDYVDFYMVAQPRSPFLMNSKAAAPQKPRVTRKIDESSMAAAQAWMKSTKELEPGGIGILRSQTATDPLLAKQYDFVSKAFGRLSSLSSGKAQLSSDGNGNDNNNNDVRPDIIPAEAAASDTDTTLNEENGDEVFIPGVHAEDLNNDNDNFMMQARWRVDVGVLFRLVVGYFLFVQGASLTRTVLYFTGGIIYYFIETGLLTMLLSWLFPDFARRQREAAAARHGGGGVPPVGRNNGNVPDDGNANNGGGGDALFGDPLLNFQAPPPPQQQQQPPQQQQQEARGAANAAVGRGGDGVGDGDRVGRAGGEAFADHHGQVNNNNNAQHVPGAAAAAAVAAAGGGAAVAGAVGDLPLTQILADYSYNGAPVPKAAGILLDLYSLVSSAVLSLVPEWSPYGR